MDAVHSNKRSRDGSEDSTDESKRIRADLLLDILNDNKSDTAAEDIASVIRSLEYEIGFSAAGQLPQTHLGFLLEASDDELGLPPMGSVTEAKPVTLEWETEGQIWGLDDEITSSYGYEFDDGVFDYYSDELFLPTAHYCDASWLQESAIWNENLGVGHSIRL